MGWTVNDEARMTNDGLATFSLFPSGYQRRLLLLVFAGLFALSGASCPQFLQQYTNPPPRVLPPSPTLEQVIDVVNRNNSQIQSFSANNASITGSGFPALRASVAFQRQKRFRLRAETGLTGAEFDLGSNDELFWFWVRREQPPAMYYCRHDQFAASQARQTTPIHPEWLIEAMGVAEFDPALPHQGPYALPNDRLEIRTVRETPDGPAMKVTVIDGSQGWILEQHLFDARRQLIASSIAGNHRRDPLSGLIMPMVVQVNCPPAKFFLRIDLGNVQINRLSGNPAELWSMPNYPGTPFVNLADPNFQPPRAAAPAAVSARPQQLPPGWRRPTR
jgi:hypothetical protein